MTTWDEILKGIGHREIDATEMDREKLLTLFNHLEQEESDRIQKEIYEAVTSIEDSGELVATVIDIVSTIAGISLKIVARIG